MKSKLSANQNNPDSSSFQTFSYFPIPFYPLQQICNQQRSSTFARIDDIPQVTDTENEILISEFTEAVVREAIFQMEHNKAPGPDDFPAEFYQTFWDTTKGDLMAMFSEFHKGELPLYNLNFGTIILLPKCKEAIKIQQYRPICLLNVSFKIFTKVATNRISMVERISWRESLFYTKPFMNYTGKNRVDLFFKLILKKHMTK